MSSENDDPWKKFHELVESADRKFARVRDLPPHYPAAAEVGHCFHKAFKSYMRLWKHQQEKRSKLVEAGLNRWEIGEIASRIGQLYFSQYMRTSEARFLVEAYVFYEAILSRKYFEGSKVKGLRIRAKELRFYARFLQVALILNRVDTVKLLMENFIAVVNDCKATFRETNFKEWKIVVQEIVRFMNVDTAYISVRPLRYCATLDNHPISSSYITRFHAKKVMKFKDAVLASYHRNEVKFAELTLDTHRMLQCLEWEPSGSFYRKRLAESNENGGVGHSGTSGLIDMNLTMDMTDTSLPPNPRKAILYRPTVTHLLAVIATICEGLQPESVMLIYLSAPGKTTQYSSSQTESSGDSLKSSKSKSNSEISQDQNCSTSKFHVEGQKNSGNYYNSCLWFGPKGSSGANTLFPADIIPFTRRPLFLIIDSDNSHAFKAGLSELLHGFEVLQDCCSSIINRLLYPFDVPIIDDYERQWTVIHGTERGERAALFLSPLRSAYRNLLDSAAKSEKGSQFTFFLTSPIPAFCQLVGLVTSDIDADCNDAENMLSTAFSGWEVILCTSTDLDLVWAQVLSDPFIRRLILRFIFCRAVLHFFCSPEDSEHYLPLCLPGLPHSVSPQSEPVRSAVLQISDHFGVADYFHFRDP